MVVVNSVLMNHWARRRRRLEVRAQRKTWSQIKLVWSSPFFSFGFFIWRRILSARTFSKFNFYVFCLCFVCLYFCHFRIFPMGIRVVFLQESLLRQSCAPYVWNSSLALRLMQPDILYFKRRLDFFRVAEIQFQRMPWSLQRSRARIWRFRYEGQNTILSAKIALSVTQVYGPLNLSTARALRSPAPTHAPRCCVCPSPPHSLFYSLLQLDPQFHGNLGRSIKGEERTEAKTHAVAVMPQRSTLMLLQNRWRTNLFKDLAVARWLGRVYASGIQRQDSYCYW